MGETTNNKSTTTEPKKDTKNCITKHILNTTPIHTMLVSMCQQHQNHRLITNSSKGHQRAYRYLTGQIFAQDITKIC